ncbi:MAG: nicotinate-nicotinamide nucleotide adenylyltransferase [Brevinematia bacterium]
MDHLWRWTHKRMKEKIGLFGGCFNPPHNAHIKIIHKALNYFDFSKLIVMPVYIPPHKNIDDSFSPEMRYFMTGVSLYYFSPEELDKFYNPLWDKEKWQTFKNFYEKNFNKNHNPKIILSDYEIKKETVSYTIDTVKYLKTIYENSEIFVIIGMDEAKILESWKNYEELIKLANFVVAKRPGFNEKEILSHFKFLQTFPFEETNLSSSIIRKKIKNKEDISTLVPEVLNLLIQHFL